MPLLYSLALFVAFAVFFAVFRVAIGLIFDRRLRNVALLPRLTILAILGLLTLLSFNEGFWPQHLYGVPGLAAMVGLLHFVVTACRSSQSPEPAIDENRLPVRHLDVGYTCGECSAPVPDAMDRCPCCARKVPWEARAGELLPIPTGPALPGPESLPVPSGAPGP